MQLLDSYLESGLIGMARGGKQGWFYAHFGAALLAGYFMNQEHDLPEHVRRGIEQIGEGFRRNNPEWYLPLNEPKTDPALLERVINGLAVNTEKLTSSGHGFALGVLALKALRQRPDLITHEVVEGLVQVLDDTTRDRANRYWGIRNYQEVTEADIAEDFPPYADTLEMAERTFGELHTVVAGRKIDGVMYHFAGEIEHSVTFAQALTDLERFGYTDLVKAGMVNHRIQMYLNRQMPEELLSEQVRQPLFTSVLSLEYWSKTYQDPHALKVPYAAMDLLRRLPEEKREEAEYGVCKLLTIMK
ncbi:hypothetical protein NDK47_02370 [Brevibacillus ruminantium]|uniref:Lanthionine synthetase n=1 Tax=Brevibacillus ruminantium TaxID=2950604 RepID=A0ABY4WLE9_9BACL|nr:hypothetical protein [Brevibacillus ruminantium]USG66199.1 hypothetical protein NDK47_02370 [Brevibacillus ruminantium]